MNENETRQELEKIEASLADVTPSANFQSPAGDRALELTDKLFAQLETVLRARLPDGWFEEVILLQLKSVYSGIRFVIQRQLS